VDQPTLLLVDDHELFAQSLAFALRQQGFRVVVQAPAHEAAVLAAVDAEQPALVLVDLDLGPPVVDGLALIGPLVDRGVRVGVLSGATDPERLAGCLAAGAEGVLSKSVAFDVLVDRLRAALDRDRLMTPADRSALAHRARARRAERGRRLERFSRLTARERAVLHGLVEGESAEVIARRAYVSLATVRSQIRAVLQKLAVNSQLEAVALARRAGWPDTGPPA